MNGRELERMLELIDANTNRFRNEILQYAQEHKEDLLRKLDENGEAVIPTSNGENLVLRKPVAAA